jgi:formylglycine-generating enzyme
VDGVARLGIPSGAPYCRPAFFVQRPSLTVVGPHDGTRGRGSLGCREKMMRKSRGLVVVLFGCVGLVAACGGSDDTESTPASGAGGNAATGGTAGTGGSSNVGGTGGASQGGTGGVGQGGAGGADAGATDGSAGNDASSGFGGVNDSGADVDASAGAGGDAGAGGSDGGDAAGSDGNAVVDAGPDGSGGADVGDGATTDTSVVPDASGDGADGAIDSASDTSAADAKTDATVPVNPDGGTFVPPNAQSCAADAGALQCNGESCCASIVVPGGTFPMGRGTESCGTVGCQSGAGNEACPTGMTCYSDEQPEHSATVSAFALDKYDVTVGRFRGFVAAYEAGWRPAAGSGANPNVPTAADASDNGTGWRQIWDDSAGAGVNLPATGTFANIYHLTCSSESQWTASPGANENKAVSCVNWYEAFAFCVWDGGRLPTESEWEYAAAGGAENRLYPWGNAVPDCTYADFWAGSNCGPGATLAIAPVGSYPAGNGRWGHADLAGNVLEWNLDWYGAYDATARVNYANLTAASYRVSRGGRFDVDATHSRAAFRADVYYPTTHGGAFGLRCARAVP